MRRCGFLFVLMLLAAAPSWASGLIVPGDLYSSYYELSESLNTIYRYSPDGTFLDYFTVPNVNEIRGMVVGPDDLLYAVTVNSALTSNVIAIDGNGLIEQTYQVPSPIYGNTNYGKIAFASNGQFYVAGAFSLFRYTPGSATGTVIYASNENMADVDPLPDGNLLVLTASAIHEIKPDGTEIRTINPSISLDAAQGLAYDSTTNDIYVTMLGYTGESHQLMQVDGDTGQVKKQITFEYPEDLFLTSDARLLVGSRTQSPGIFDLDLNRIGSLGIGASQFVTQAVPEPSTLALLALGAFGLFARRRFARSVIHC
jgi:hypothetical protein